jgi:hypothetical protein
LVWHDDHLGSNPEKKFHYAKKLLFPRAYKRKPFYQHLTKLSVLGDDKLFLYKVCYLMISWLHEKSYMRICEFIYSSSSNEFFYDKLYEGKRFWRLTYLIWTLVSPHYMRNQMRICEFFSFSLLTWVLVDEKSFEDKRFWHPRSTWESITFSLRVWKISESSVHIMENYDHSFFGSAEIWSSVTQTLKYAKKLINIAHQSIRLTILRRLMYKNMKSKKIKMY